MGERVIRPARLADLEALTRMHLAAFRAGHEAAVAPATLDELTPERMRERWEQRLTAPGAGSVLLVAEGAGRLVGTAGSGPPRDDDVDRATTGELYSLYVDPRDWGAGHGAVLHDAALAHLRGGGFGAAVLWVMEANPRARRFYAARGWSTEGARREWEGAWMVRLSRALAGQRGT